jgi:hypothetical protein
LFVYGSDLQGEINCKRLCDNHSDRLGNGYLESIRNNAHAINAWRKRRRDVSAFAVGWYSPDTSSGEVSYRYFSSGDDGPVWVFDGSGDAAGGLI